MQNFDLWLAVDNEGNSAVSMDGPAEAREAVVDEYESAAVRVVKLAVLLELPEVPEIEVHVPASEEDLVIAEAEKELEHA